jgi:hypothetical protein
MQRGLYHVQLEVQETIATLETQIQQGVCVMAVPREQRRFERFGL